MAFETLKPYRPRVYLPQEIDLGDVATVSGIYRRLSGDLTGVKTVEGLQEWLDHYGEAMNAINEEREKRYIAKTCHSDDPAIIAAHLHFATKVDPETKADLMALKDALAAHPCFAQLPPYYDVYRKSIENDRRLYKKENTPRLAREAELNDAYATLNGNMTVEIDGREQSLSEAKQVLLETDRSRRQAAFEKITGRRVAEREKIDAIYSQLVALRHQIALEAGFENYRDYMFAFNQRAYSPDDCLTFHKTIEEHIVPLARQIERERLQTLRAAGELGPDEPLRPWDMEVDPLGRPPLHPFTTGQELFDKVEQAFRGVDSRFLESFRLMREHGTTDLETRAGKEGGGYLDFLTESAVPFIFMNAAQSADDVDTLKHENGHATHHTLAARNQRLFCYADQNIPMEMCELASMSAELLCAPGLDGIYAPEEAARLRKDQLEKIILFLPWMATVDAFQHWVYTHPDHTVAQRDEAFLDLRRRFGGIDDWSGHEAAQTAYWHKQSHIVENPFYYIDYGVAQIGALQVERNAQKDRGAALDAYFHALAQGGSKPLAELYRDAGVKLDFSAETVVPLVESIRQELDLPAPAGVPVPREIVPKDLGFARKTTAPESEPQPQKTLS